MKKKFFFELAATNSMQLDNELYDDMIVEADKKYNIYSLSNLTRSSVYFGKKSKE